MQVEDYKRHAVDMVITDALAEQLTAELFSTVVKQFVAAAVRASIDALDPTMTMLSETPEGHSDRCTVTEPHAHAGIQYRIVPTELLVAGQD